MNVLKNRIEHFEWMNGVVFELNLEKEGFAKIKFSNFWLVFICLTQVLFVVDLVIYLPVIYPKT